ncbi:MAG: hypothetical protein A2Y95_06230 [Deltaproteobacteria bacterium RBG_13_65_10]|nr:MAG: hypothetical protein A2Y95_06230 [Deltaproteobacteria bacterium RBG_13_65_10]
MYPKTEGPYQKRVHGWMWRTFGLFLVLFMLTTIFTLAAVPGATQNLVRHPVLWIIPVANVLAVANIPRAIHYGKPGYAFASSIAVILALVSLIGLALFPNLVARAWIQPDPLQRRFQREDPTHHADHRRHRYSRRARLHDERVLDIPRKSASRRAQLLTGAFLPRPSLLN